MHKLRLDVWSDIACPWCYIGKRHLEEALATFEHKDEVEIVWRAFELDPTAPKLRDHIPTVERLAKKFGASVAQATQMIDRVIATGKAAGLELRLHATQLCNTFDAHRVLHWALDEGKQLELKERLMRAYMTESSLVSDHEVLIGLARDVGLDEAEARAMLASDRYADAVRTDEALARELGITGVPFFVMAGRIGVSGAQPAEALKGALAKAWAERPQLEQVEQASDGATCGPDSCD